MRVIYAAFKYEAKRILGDQKLLLYLILLLLISFYCVKEGVASYNRALQYKENFKTYEHKKTRQYVNYTQYAGYGFRIFLEPSPLMVFFDSSSLIDDVQSNIDSLEVIKMVRSYKGRNIFYPRSSYKDFAGAIYLLGSLLMIYMGVGSFISLREVKFWIERKGFVKYFFKTLLVRNLMVSAFFAAIFLLAYLYGVICGIELNAQEKIIYIIYGLYSITFMSLFFFLGALLKILVRFRGYVYGAAILVWFCFVYVAPEVHRAYLFSESLTIPSNSSVDLKKVSNMMAFERSVVGRDKAAENMNPDERRKFFYKMARQFLDSYYLLNKNIELTLQRNVKELVNKSSLTALYIPTCFYSYISGELSSKGYNNYLGFMEYVIKLRESFLEYYLKRKFSKNNKQIEYFVKGEENVYKANVKVPDKIWWSLGIIFIYILIFVHVAYVKLKKQVYR